MFRWGRAALLAATHFAAFLLGFWFTVGLLGSFIDWPRITSKALYLLRTLDTEEAQASSQQLKQRHRPKY